MSDYAYVADRAKRAFASVARLENELVKRPGDRSLSINLTSMRRLAQQAQIEMERLAEMNQIEVCRYRMVPAESADYGLGVVARSQPADDRNSVAVIINAAMLAAVEDGDDPR